MLAHLKALETRRDPQQREAWKFRLERGLYERGFSAEDLRHLFRLIDWLMELPPALDNLFWEEIEHFQEEHRMPFITTPERIGIKRGMLLMLERFLRSRFGEEGVQLLPEIRALEDADKYLSLADSITAATTLAEVRQACATAAAPPEPPKKKGRRKRDA